MLFAATCRRSDVTTLCERYDLDAAIIFADILVVPHAMGNGLSFVEGEGPKVETVRGSSDLARLKAGLKSKQFESVAESVNRVRHDLTLPFH
jgi:uroporphyrinogen decarboxylase